MKLGMKSPRSYEPKNVVQDRLETQEGKMGSKIGQKKSQSLMQAELLLAQEKHK
jgi:hypothetical protein